MVACVRNLTSSSSTAEYFHEERGYYAAAGGHKAVVRAKAIEHRLASAWHGQGLAALGLRAGQKVSATMFETILRRWTGSRRPSCRRAGTIPRPAGAPA